eukprot:gene44841-59852_t
MVMARQCNIFYTSDIKWRSIRRPTKMVLQIAYWSSSGIYSIVRMDNSFANILEE